MDTSDPGQHHLDGTASLLIQDISRDESESLRCHDESESLRAFERFVQSCFSSPADDDEFWATIAGRVEHEERCMDAKQAQRFEIAVDYFLTMHGLPAWTVVRQRNKQTASQRAL